MRDEGVRSDAADAGRVERQRESVSSSSDARGADVKAQTRLGPMPKFVDPGAGRASHGDGILRGGVPERGSRPPRAGQMTALHYAAREGHTAVATLLLENGARIDQPEANGVRPLLLAIMNDRAGDRPLSDRAGRGCQRGRLVRALAAVGRRRYSQCRARRRAQHAGSRIAQARWGSSGCCWLAVPDPNARTRESPPGRIWLMQAGSLSWVDFTGADAVPAGGACGRRDHDAPAA